MFERPDDWLPDRTVPPDIDPPLGDLRRWHDSDRPECPLYVLQLGPPGFACATCEWWVGFDDEPDAPR